MNNINNIPTGKNPPSDIYVIIEIPKGSNIKYEVNDEFGALFVDRKLFTAMNYPFNYGFIPQTKEEDGDPVDVLILGNDQYFPLSVVRSKPIGVLITEDEEGKDSKIIAVPHEKIDTNYSKYNEIEQVEEGILNQIKHFFEHYKELEKGKFVKVKEWEGKSIAEKIIKSAFERYRNNPKEP